MRLNTSTPENDQHKQLLKRALVGSYNSILQGQKKPKKSRFIVPFKQLAFAATGLALFVGIMAINVFGPTSQINSNQVFASIIGAYGDYQDESRYLYMRATTTTNAPGFSGTIAVDRYIDTQTGNERYTVFGQDFEFTELIIDGETYSSDTSAFDAGLSMDDNNMIEQIESFFNNVDENGFPNGYKAIGINSYEELDAADLSAKEIDDRLESAGLPKIGNPFGDNIDSQFEEFYTLKPSELQEKYGVGPESSLDELPPEQDICTQEGTDSLVSIDTLFDGFNPNELIGAFTILQESGQFEISEEKRNGAEVYAIRATNDLPSIGKNDVIYVSQDTYRVTEAISITPYGEARIVIDQFGPTNTPVNTSTEGLQYSGPDIPISALPESVC